MGGCATKLRIWKGNVALVPKPPDEQCSVEEAKLDPARESKPENNIDTKEQLFMKMVAQNTGQHDLYEIYDVPSKAKEIVDDDDKVDDQGAKRRSLSLLFKENLDDTLATEDDNAREKNRQETIGTEKLIVQDPSGEPPRKEPRSNEKLSGENEKDESVKQVPSESQHASEGLKTIEPVEQAFGESKPLAGDKDKEILPIGAN